MKKRLIIVTVIIIAVIAGGYFYLRYGVLKAKDFKPAIAKEKNAIDLRPSIIAKLQQLIKDGSNGLYNLSIDKLDPDILASTVNVTKASIRIDTAGMKRLDSLHLLPDDIFTFTFKSLQIDGLGINDLLHTNKINITGIHIVYPIVNVYHKKRSYNAAERRHTDTLTLYDKLKGQMKQIAIKTIDIKQGTFINHDLEKNKISRFNDVSVLVDDVLIDSTTRFDTKRYLFSKHVTVHSKNYTIATADSVYFFKVGDISISGDQHNIVAQNVELKPRLSREQFKKRLQFGKDLYHLISPKIILHDVDWQALVNNEKFISNSAEIVGGNYSIYFDRSVPQGPMKLDNFPQQALFKLPFPFSIKKIKVDQVDFSYEEHNPVTDKNGIIYLDKVSAVMNNVTNIAAEIKKQKFLNVSAKTLLLHHVPLSVNFKFDLAKHTTGDFSAVIHVDTLDNKTINPIAEPLGFFSVKTGQMQKAIIQVTGNNYKTNGTMQMLYSDLHIAPLKKDEAGNLKVKKVTGLLANVILIKNENPSGQELRKPAFEVERGSHKNFFNLLWSSILTGLVKTVGIPTKFVKK